MVDLPPSPLLGIRAWVFDGNNRLVGVVVDTGERWTYRPFAPADRLDLPVPTVKLVTTLRRYLAEGPDSTNLPGPNL